MSIGSKLRAKKIACKIAAMLLEEDVALGGIRERYGSLKKDSDGPSVEAIEAGAKDLIEELVKRGRIL